MARSFSLRLFFLLFITVSARAELVTWDVAKDDIWQSITLMGRGFTSQFNGNNLVHAAIFTPALWHAFSEDDRYVRYFQSKPHSGIAKVISDSAIFMNFPFFSAGVYYLGKKRDDSKLVQFAKENFAANYLAALQTMMVSFLEVNERPNQTNQSFWETAFRGKSSFPSGHVLPYFVLTMKTFQFYGPFYALIPLNLALITSYERLQSGRHYMSDVVGGAAMAVFASEGVRAAAKFHDNHPVFKWIYEHEAAFMPVISKDLYAFNLHFSY